MEYIIFFSGGFLGDNVDSNAKSNIFQQKDDAKDEPVVEVDGLEGVDTLGALIRHLG